MSWRASSAEFGRGPGAMPGHRQPAAAALKLHHRLVRRQADWNDQWPRSKGSPCMRRREPDAALLGHTGQATEWRVLAHSYSAGPGRKETDGFRAESTKSRRPLRLPRAGELRPERLRSRIPVSHTCHTGTAPSGRVTPPSAAAAARAGCHDMNVARRPRSARGRTPSPLGSAATRRRGPAA